MKPIQWMPTRLGVAALALVGLVGCAGAPPLHEQLKVDVIRAGVVLSNFKNNGIADRLDTMAVASVEEALTDRGLMQMMGSGLNKVMGEKEARLQLVTRDQLTQVMREQRFQLSGVVNQDQMVELGKVAGLHVVITVEPTSMKSEDTSYRKNENLYCVDRKAYAGMRITAVRVDTGAVVISGFFEGDADDDDCDRSSYRKDKLDPADMLIREAAQEAAEHFASDFRSKM